MYEKSKLHVRYWQKLSVTVFALSRNDYIKISVPVIKTLVSFMILKVKICCICGFATFVLMTFGFDLSTTLAKAFSIVLASLQ